MCLAAVAGIPVSGAGSAAGSKKVAARPIRPVIASTIMAMSGRPGLALPEAARLPEGIAEATGPAVMAAFWTGGSWAAGAVVAVMTGRPACVFEQCVV